MNQALKGLKVAVIGAGPAGLVSAREALRHGCTVTVFEAGNAVGGVWVYSEAVEDDPLGQRSSQLVHSSLYDSLSTNLPRDLMAFSDYTFDTRGGGEDGWPRFPHHTCVRQYLDRFADDFDVRRHINFNTPVTSVNRQGDRWQVNSAKAVSTFDAVIICNGHYSRPRVPDLPGLEHFKGEVVHAHNYRNASHYAGKRVAVWGTSASGFDLANEVGGVAESVYWCGNVFTGATNLGENKRGLPSPKKIDESGRLCFGDPEYHVEVDMILFCTGYHYDFPFLEAGIVDVEDNWVHPLYQDIVPPDDPSLGFIGLPFLIVPFPVFEMQARWFVKQLVSEFSLPDVSERKAQFQRKIDGLVEASVLKRHYHRLGEAQVAYFNGLAEQSGCDPMPAWFLKTWADSLKARDKDPINYKQAIFPVRGPTVCTIQD